MEDGRSALVRKSADPYFFIKTVDEKKAKTLTKDFPLEFEETTFKDFAAQPVTKVTTHVPGDVPKIRELYEKSDVECFEADIRFAYRAMMDWGIHSVFSVVGDEQRPTKNQYVDVVIENPVIESLKEEFLPKLSVLSFDIESDKHTEALYCLSVYCIDQHRKQKIRKLIVSEEPVEGATYFPDEKSLLEAFVRIIQEIDPDVVTGWNVIDFDLALIARHAKKYKVNLSFGRDGSELRTRLESSFFRESSATMNGRLVLDGIHLLKNSFIKLPNYKLATAAKEFTDSEKLIEAEGKEKYEEINALYKNDKKALLEYNYMDAKLVIDILNKSGAFELTVKRSLLTGMPLDRVTASIASLDSLYLRELRQRGVVAPVVKNRRRDQGVGGFVMTSKPGVYDYVIVCDFKSLYPSIMRTFNIDPMMYVEDDKATKDMIEAPNGAHFKRELGIIPGLIQKFWNAREEARKNNDELARYAIKIHMNSMYGVLASPNCRFFNRQVGNAITSFAKKFITLAADIVEKSGYEVIYGDTDSIFVNLSCESYDIAQELGKRIEKEINTFLKESIKKEYKIDSFLELEFEKTFIRFVMPHLRGSDKGAKKRYAGLVRNENGGEEISFTGLEMVRRDWTDLAKEFQYELYRRVFAKEEIADYVKDVIKDLNKGLLDDKLIYRKALRKDVDEYTKTTPPHVKAAMLLDHIDSSIIEYILTINGPQPVQKLTSKIDYDHYIEKQLRPIADSLLTFYDTSFEDVVKGSSQSSLFDY